MTDREKEIACEQAKLAGADFVKTSTGLSKGGVTAADVALMRRIVGPTMGVKTSGGIRDAKDAQTMIAAGASRLGASASVATGTAGAAVDGLHTVDVLYDRQLRTGSTTSASEKLEVTLQTQPEVDVPIGQNPSTPADAQTTAEAAVGRSRRKAIRPRWQVPEREQTPRPCRHWRGNMSIARCHSPGRQCVRAITVRRDYVA